MVDQGRDERIDVVDGVAGGEGYVDERWTRSGVRLRARVRREGALNWLFLPGGPGIGAESLLELVDVLDVPGICWLVDLPGDGSNTDPPGAGADPYSGWPQVLIEAAEAVPNPVYVGHSTGGMYLLSTPALEEALVGLALVSTAPDARWLPEFVAMTERHPLPEVVAATAAYEQDPTDENLGALAVCSAAWNFSPGTVEAGAALLARMPYNGCCLHRPSRRHHRGPWAQGWVIRRCVVGSAAFLHHGRTGGRRRWRAGLR